MSNFVVRSLALAVVALAPALSFADTYKVEVDSTVAETDTQTGIAGVMPVGSTVTMSFTVDSTNFLNSPSYPTRGYVIDPSSFMLTANGVNIGVTLSSPTYFVLRNNDPKVDGFFIGDNTDYDSSFNATVPGLSSAFQFDYHETWTGGNQLNSLDIADAVGTFDQHNISVYQMDLELGSGYVAVTFDVPSVTISAVPVPEPATMALMGLGLVAVAVTAAARRRKSA